MRNAEPLILLLLLASCGSSSDVVVSTACVTDAGAIDAVTSVTSESAPDDAADGAAREVTHEASREASEDALVDASSEPLPIEGGADSFVSDVASDDSFRADAPADARPESGTIHPDAGRCDDNRKNGDETDIDCGDSCLACGMGQGCLVDSDCGSWPGCDVKKGGCTCDAVSMKCAYDHCSDHKKNYGESATDCGGGECPGCAVDQTCELDSDCASQGCDSISMTCVSNRCADHHPDGAETGTDCGGGACPGCPVGDACNLDFDCASRACDGISNTCTQDACMDHRRDGTETDVDCGGPDCPGLCEQGKKCQFTSDCKLGYTCSATLPHVCL